ncbi:MAG: hypothetical protein RJA99_3528 [Pseudomonadota bacterium]|jgi:two-component system heavy metal sensor histidine kinase CusS
MSGRGPSLSLRLSLSLAVLAFVGLGTVCSFVYVVTAEGLDARQHAELEETATLVSHLVKEAEPTDDALALRQTLADVDSGYAGMELRVAPPGDGPPLFISPNWAAARSTHQRSMWVVVPWRHEPEGRLVVKLRLDTRADDELLATLRATLLAGALLGAAAIALVSHALVRRGLAPIGTLAAQLRAIRPGDGTVHVDVGARHRELREFVERFNALLAEVDAAYAQLAAFNADVAHELRTPLAELIADSEVMLSRTRDADAWRDAAGRHLEDLRRLAAIVADMLFLARADHSAPPRTQSVPSLAALVDEVAVFHEAACEEQDLSVRVIGDASGRVDAQLVKRAVSNLLSNAARFARTGSTVDLRIERSDGAVRVLACNEGPDIAQEDLPHLFERFRRAAPGRADGAAHHGLGLAIVAAIARMHGGRPLARSAHGRTEIGLELHDRPTTEQPAEHRPTDASPQADAGPDDRIPSASRAA